MHGSIRESKSEVLKMNACKKRKEEQRLTHLKRGENLSTWCYNLAILNQNNI